MTMTHPTVAIVGRPNVGKSTLFNRLAGKKLALVHDQPGVTRDRREAMGSLGDLTFRMIDTAGLADPEVSHLTAEMAKQTDKGIQEADVVLFIIDGREGCTPYDQELADLMRRQKKPILVVVNKCEGNKAVSGISDAYALGLGDIIAISAEHGEGLTELFDGLAEHIEPVDEESLEAEKPLKLAIIGRPNAGKSTLINKLIGEERLITGDMPGLTRDAISIDWEYKGQKVTLVDTAGMRRRSKVQGALEKLSVMDARRTIQYAEVVVMMLDATCPLEKQDLIIASHAVEEGRAVVVAVNKWDLVKDKKKLEKDILFELGRVLSQVHGVPLIPISAQKGQNLEKLMKEIFSIYRLWNLRLPTGELNRWLEERTSAHPPPAVSGRRIRPKYITQIKTRPPTLALFCTQGDKLPDSYVRYLVNSLREDFDLPGVPIRLQVRKQKNPYTDK